MMHRREQESRRRRRLLFLLSKTYGTDCFWCDKPMCHPDIKGHVAKKPSIEHLVPRSRGGGEHGNNFVLAHRICNMDRSARLLTRKEAAKAARIIALRHLRLFAYRFFRLPLKRGWLPYR